MAYRDPVFYAYHGMRLGTNPVAGGGIAGTDVSQFFDSRQGDLFVYSTDLDAGEKQIIVDRNDTAFGDAIDTIIVSGHNFNGAALGCFTDDGAGDSFTMVTPSQPVTEENGELIIVDLNQAPDPVDPRFKIRLRIIASAAGAVVPQLSEVFFTIKSQMIRGPQPDFNSSWKRNQTRRLNPAGVTTTTQAGPARKTYTLTWSQLEGADRQILLDLRTHTSDWAFPFFFTPPDDAFPTVFVELDRDEVRIQDFIAPKQAGTSDRVTLPMIEVLG